jgi:hypothetical protein
VTGAVQRDRRGEEVPAAGVSWTSFRQSPV